MITVHFISGLMTGGHGDCFSREQASSEASGAMFIIT